MKVWICSVLVIELKIKGSDVSTNAQATIHVFSESHELEARRHLETVRIAKQTEKPDARVETRIELLEAT